MHVILNIIVHREYMKGIFIDKTPFRKNNVVFFYVLHLGQISAMTTEETTSPMPYRTSKCVFIFEVILLHDYTYCVFECAFC